MWLINKNGNLQTKIESDKIMFYLERCGKPADLKYSDIDFSEALHYNLTLRLAPCSQVENVSLYLALVWGEH